MLMADESMRDVASPWTSSSRKPAVAFDGAYLALLSALPQNLVRASSDHPCPQLASRGARALGLQHSDASVAEVLARTRVSRTAWVGSTVLDWARRVIAAAHAASD